MVFRFAALCIAITSAFAGVDPRSVTIERDTWGVPHIYAKTDAGAAYGLMYAQAEDNFWQLEADYIRIVGRAAEVEGLAKSRATLCIALMRSKSGPKRPTRMPTQSCEPCATPSQPA